MRTKSKKSHDWIVMGGRDGETAHCTRCGRGLEINLPQAIPILVAAMKAFEKMHATCPAGNFYEPPITTPAQWVSSRDTGTSSLTIYSVMTGRNTPHGRYDIPYDPQDFGRCYRLLKLFPDWRKRLSEVAKQHTAWKSLVENWDELTNLYEQELPTGKAPKLYDRMQTLRLPLTKGDTDTK